MGEVVKAPMSNKRDRKYHAERISGAWNKQIRSIIETGQALIDAKGELDHGEFEAMLVEDELPFKRLTAYRLREIAAHRILANVSYTIHLPISWATLFELTRVPDDVLLAAFKNGSIHPRMKCEDAKKMLDQARRAAAKKDTAAILGLEQIHPGARILGAPDGMSITEWVRSLLEQEKTDGRDATLKTARIAYSTFHDAAEIVALSQIPLKPRDADICKHAMLLLDSTASVAAPYRMVLPISQKVWQGKKTIHTVETATQIANDFRDRIATLLETCEIHAAMPVPYLTEEAAKPYIKELKAAMRSVSSILKTVRKEAAL